ncbi:hypothetical protein K474DRAFT_1439137 [Panus rudis PR-1116 ss-1]|nr:hypothetical protein K474DRAFT_1439137 [Panus rudis PR-1116 ss-1]
MLTIVPDSPTFYVRYLSLHTTVTNRTNVLKRHAASTALEHARISNMATNTNCPSTVADEAKATFVRKTRKPIVTLNQKRPVTWTQIVGGQYFLIASSDKDASEITLWRISDVLESRRKPIAETLLSAPVADGRAEVQGNDIIIALFLRGRISSIMVLTVRTVGEEQAFYFLRSWDGVGHIRFLREKWLGIALNGGVNVPCLFNWDDGRFWQLWECPRSEGGCMAMDLADGMLAVTTRTTLFLYKIFADPEEPPTLTHSQMYPVSVGYVELRYARPESLDGGMEQAQIYISAYLGRTDFIFSAEKQITRVQS